MIRNARPGERAAFVMGGSPSVALQLPGTRAGYFCVRCSSEVALAKSSQRQVAAGAKVICIECAAEDFQVGKCELALPSRADMISDMGGDN